MKDSFSDTFRAIIFDLDGTLLDTLADIGNAMNRVLGRQGFPVHALSTYKQLVGEGMALLVRRALPEPMSEDQVLVNRLSASMREEYSMHSMDATRAYPGIRDLLTDFRQLNIAIAVLSNKPDDMVHTLVEHYFPNISLNAVSGASELFPRKPDPAGALAIAQRLGVPPEYCIFLGDSKTDMETAVAAGMYPVGALWGFREAGELLVYGAKALIKRPEELLAMVKANDKK